MEEKSFNTSEVETSLRALPDTLLSMTKEQIVSEVAKPMVDFLIGIVAIPYTLSQFKTMTGEQRFILKNLIDRSYYQLPDTTDWDYEISSRQQFDLQQIAVALIPQMITTANSRMPFGQPVSSGQVPEWTPSQDELFSMLSDITFGGIELLSVVYNESLREPFMRALCCQGKRQMGALWTDDLGKKAVRLVGMGINLIRFDCDVLSAFALAQNVPLPDSFKRFLSKISESKHVPKNVSADQSLRDLLQVPEHYKPLIKRSGLTEAEAVDKLMAHISDDLQHHEKQRSSRIKGIMLALEQEKWIRWSELGRHTQYRLLRQAFREQLTGFKEDTFRKEGVRENKVAKEEVEQLREMFRRD